MDKTGILCNRDRDVMLAFSRRSLDKIDADSLLSRSLSLFSAYLDANVRKEIAKDRLIISEAAAAFSSGSPACDLDLEDLFEKTKRIDHDFLKALPGPRLSLRYSDFADIRIQRIWRLGKTAHTLLDNWPERSFITEAVRNSYTSDSFRSNLSEILHLYSMETRLLTRSLRLVPPFNRMVATFAETLFHAMEETTAEVADQFTDRVFGTSLVPA